MDPGVVNGVPTEPEVGVLTDPGVRVPTDPGVDTVSTLVSSLDPKINFKSSKITLNGQNLDNL